MHHNTKLITHAIFHGGSWRESGGKEKNMIQKYARNPSQEIYLMETDSFGAVNVQSVLVYASELRIWLYIHK